MGWTVAALRPFIWALYLREELMVLIAQTETKVNCSVNHAFSIVSNMERFGDWFPSVISINSLNDLAHGEVGKKYIETVSVPLQGKREIEIEVKESIENQSFVTEGRFPPLLPRMEVEISETAENQTNIKWCMFSRTNSQVVKMLLLPLAKSIMQKRANIGAAQLKALLEQANT